MAGLRVCDIRRQVSVPVEHIVVSDGLVYTITFEADVFGSHNVGTIFGWIFASHQLGAASAAWLGGIARDALGSYQMSFIAAGVLALTGGLMALRINREARPALERTVPRVLIARS